MGNTREATHLQDREPGGLRHAAPLPIVEANHSGASLPEVAQRTRGEYGDQQRESAVLQHGRNHIEVGNLLGRRGVGALEQHLQKAGALREFGNVAQRDGGAREAGGRQQQRQGIKIWQPVAIPGLQA